MRKRLETCSGCVARRLEILERHVLEAHLAGAADVERHGTEAAVPRPRQRHPRARPHRSERNAGCWRPGPARRRSIRPAARYWAARSGIRFRRGAAEVADLRRGHRGLRVLHRARRQARSPAGERRRSDAHLSSARGAQAFTRGLLAFGIEGHAIGGEISGDERREDALHSAVRCSSPRAAARRSCIPRRSGTTRRTRRPDTPDRRSASRRNLSACRRSRRSARATRLVRSCARP